MPGPLLDFSEAQPADSLPQWREYLGEVYLPPGEQGTPQPYTVRGDNLFTLTLLACLVIGVLAFNRSAHALLREAKAFFLKHYTGSDVTTSSYPSLLLFMLPMCCMLLALGSYITVTDGLAGSLPLAPFLGRQSLPVVFAIDSQPLVIALLFALFALYFMLKWVVYGLVNEVLFGSKKRLQWSHALLFLASMECALLFPLVMLMVYFDLSVKIALICLVFILFLNKMLAFYKSWNIFFKGNAISLQIFLYFCALEMAPLLALAGLWLSMVNLLKVNF